MPYKKIPYKRKPPKFKYWCNEASRELGIKNYESDYITFPKKFYDIIENISKEKIYDFVFIGGLKTDETTFKNRKWILSFIYKYFNKNSYLQFTDKKTKLYYKPIDIYDFTLLKKGFVPKENIKKNYFDINYYDNMCKSKFCLCPAGDVNWSYRFFEALICKTIPIVNKKSDMYIEEHYSTLDYKYYLSTSNVFEYRNDWVEHNYNIFMKYHTLKYLSSNDLNNKKVFYKKIYNIDKISHKDKIDKLFKF